MWERLRRNSQRTPTWLFWLFIVLGALGVARFFLQRPSPINWALLVFWLIYLLLAVAVLLQRRRKTPPASD